MGFEMEGVSQEEADEAAAAYDEAVKSGTLSMDSFESAVMTECADCQSGVLDVAAEAEIAITGETVTPDTVITIPGAGTTTGSTTTTGTIGSSSTTTASTGTTTTGSVGDGDTNTTSSAVTNGLWAIIVSALTLMMVAQQ